MKCKESDNLEGIVSFMSVICFSVIWLYSLFHFQNSNTMYQYQSGLRYLIKLNIRNVPPNRPFHDNLRACA